MPFKIVRNDITKVKADVIVNTANPNPICASGTDLAIYEAAYRAIEKTMGSYGFALVLCFFLLLCMFLFVSMFFSAPVYILMVSRVNKRFVSLASLTILGLV